MRPNPFQPRRHFDPEGLEELRSSIQNHGLLQPVVVRRVAGGMFELIAGERRWRAAKLAGLDELPAMVREEVPDRDMLELALVENVQRKSLDAIEKAEGYHAMMRELSLTQEQVADKVGLKRSSVANHLRLLTLPEEVQDAVRTGRLSMGHARTLVGLPDAAEVLSFMNRIETEGLSVRQAEAMVRGDLDPVTPVEPEVAAESSATPPREIVPRAPWIADVEERLREHLGTKVEIKNGKEYRGQIVIDYYQREDLDRLIEMLAPRESL